jgi:uncharacterized coiled-coil protein SlyX
MPASSDPVPEKVLRQLEELEAGMRDVELWVAEQRDLMEKLSEMLKEMRRLIDDA